MLLPMLLNVWKCFCYSVSLPPSFFSDVVPLRFYHLPSWFTSSCVLVFWTFPSAHIISDHSYCEICCDKSIEKQFILCYFLCCKKLCYLSAFFVFFVCVSVHQLCWEKCNFQTICPYRWYPRDVFDETLQYLPEHQVESLQIKNI